MPSASSIRLIGQTRSSQSRHEIPNRPLLHLGPVLDHLTLPSNEKTTNTMKELENIKIQVDVTVTQNESYTEKRLFGAQCGTSGTLTRDGIKLGVLELSS